MSFSLAQILLFIIAYLTGLFAVAHLADRGITAITFCCTTLAWY